MPERILVVEDESTLGQNIARALAKQGHTVLAVETVTAALKEMEDTPYDVVITDLRLPDGDGFTVLDHARQLSPDSVVLLMTAYASVNSAVDALRRGAHDYLLKPIVLADLVRKVQHISEYRRLGRENARLRTLLGETASSAATLLRGRSRVMQDLCAMVERVAPATSNVLVIGESGTGKELVARALHDLSNRSDGPFVSLNVSAIPETLVESYLFGHERGAFTGADKRREGLFRTASGGTLFLDEVGELPLPAQAKLLRAVEAKEILPVGSDKPLQVDARVVSATHRDLAAMSHLGKFREDLLFRLGVVTLRVPPLRDRVEDIPTLVEHFVARHAREQKKRVTGVDGDAMRLLMGCPWRGNVRELSNVVERAVILTPGETITIDDLPAELRADTVAGSTLESAVLEFERKYIASVLVQTAGNREAAAKALGLSPATLYRRLQRVGLKGYRVGE
ncbi:MAG: sigma-54-dependent Fis family transcriptional regulator [Deltaproteobacteria bacterium]|nr:sigma-54-dependent Fis family transcriptional regulator [Deltaproteobacteria bacterium]